MTTPNQNPEQLARDRIDDMLRASGWVVQSRKQVNLQAAKGVVVRKYSSEAGSADYALFVNKIAVGIIETKRRYEDLQPGLKQRTPIPLAKTVDINLLNCIFKKKAGATKYTTEQVQWLRMIKDYIANWFHVDRNDFELDPLNKQGGLGKMWQLFGKQTDPIIGLSERLVA